MNRLRKRGRTVSLSPLNTAFPLRYQDIRRIDSWQPTEFPIGAYPDRPVVLRAIAEIIDEMCAAGSMDPDTGHALDERVDAWLADWSATADYELLDKQRTLATITAASAQELDRRMSLAAAAAERSELAKGEAQGARERYFAEP